MSFPLWNSTFSCFIQKVAPGLVVEIRLPRHQPMAQTLNPNRLPVGLGAPHIAAPPTGVNEATINRGAALQAFYKCSITINHVHIRYTFSLTVVLNHTWIRSQQSTSIHFFHHGAATFQFPQHRWQLKSEETKWKKKNSPGGLKQHSSQSQPFVYEGEAPSGW